MSLRFDLAKPLFKEEADAFALSKGFKSFCFQMSVLFSKACLFFTSVPSVHFSTVSKAE